MLTDFDKDKLLALMSDSPVGLLMLDAQGVITWMNDTLKRFTNSSDSLVGQSATAVGEELRRLFETPDTIFLPGGAQDNGYWLIRNRQALPDNQGQLYYFMDVSLLQELALEREELRETVRELKAIDEATGLPNRRALYQKLEPEVSRSRRYSNPLSIILMTLNNLDEIVNQVGQEKTDGLLLRVAQMLNDQLRWADIIGRLDENEFLVVLPETDIDATAQLIDKIQSMLPECTIETDTGTASVNASFGKAQWRKGDDVAMLMRRARETLEKDRSAA